MAKKTSVTHNSIHRLTSKGFVTKNKTYRGIKNVFVTVGGVYRLAWGDVTLSTVINLCYGGEWTTYTYKGDVTVSWQMASALCFNNDVVIMTPENDLTGLSEEPDNTIDIPRGETRVLKEGYTYTYYLLNNAAVADNCHSCGEQMTICPVCGARTCFNGACGNYIGDEYHYLKPYCSVSCYNRAATKVTFYWADGSLCGTLSTINSEPKLYWQCSDSGEIYLTGAEKIYSSDYYEQTGKVFIGINGYPPAGLSIANDHNLTSEGDLVWNNGNEGYAIVGDGLAATLTAGESYTYYVYSNDDLQSGGDTHIHEWIKDENGSYPPTCTQNGENFYYCSCGETYHEDVPALGHDMKNTGNGTDPTCTSAGKAYYVCNRCGEVVEETLPAIGHDYHNNNQQGATCTEDGYIDWVCWNCGHTYREKTETALGHNWQFEFNEDADCETGGYIDYSCSRCGETKREYTDALGHDMMWADDITQPTCEAKGEALYKCTRCDAEETRDIPAIGHDWHDNGDGTSTCFNCWQMKNN